jgi:serine/threonine-protein kinase
MTVGVSQLPPELAARYAPLSLLSAGAGGSVILCQDAVMGRNVILKTVAVQAASPELRARFQREGRLLAALQDPRVVRVLDVGETAGMLFLVMENLEGATLAHRIQDEGRLAEAEAAAIAAGLAEALALLEQQGILHRDVKPHNVVVVAERGPVLIDFGLAKLLDAPHDLTEPGSVMGTPLYMAPEIVAGKPASVASDIYSLGMVLYEMLAGRPAFPPGDLLDLLAAQVNEPPPPIPGVSAAMASVLDRCLAKSPQDRFATYGQLAAALAGVARGEPGARPRTNPSGPRTGIALFRRITGRTLALGHAAWRGQRRPAALALLGAILALGLAGALLVGRRASLPATDGAGRSPGAGDLARGHDGPARGRAGAAFRRMLPVLDLRTRALERSISVHCRTTEEARLVVFAGQVPTRQVPATGTGPIHEVATGPGYVHRAVLTGLEPGRTYRLALQAGDADRVVLIDPLMDRTLLEGSEARRRGSRDFEEALLEGATLLSKEPLKSLDAGNVWSDDADLPRWLARLRSSRDPVMWQAIVRILGFVGSPTTVPALVEALEREQTSVAGAAVVREALEALGMVGGREAARALERFCRTGLDRSHAPLAGERHVLRWEAAAVLARVDPPAAEQLFLSSRRGLAPSHSADVGLLALRGAGALRTGWLGAELERALAPSAATERDWELAAVARLATRIGGAGVDRLLVRFIAQDAPHLPVDESERYGAVLGLATWGTGAAVDPLARQIAARTGQPCTHGTPSETVRCYTPVRSLQALGMIAARERLEVRTAVARCLVPALSSGSTLERRIALRALAQAAVPEAAAAIESAAGRLGEPRAEIALALARSGSARAREAIGRLLASDRPTDLWLAAVAAAALGGAPSLEVLGKLRARIDSLPPSNTRILLEQSVDWLAAGGWTPDLVWVSPAAPWARTSLDLRCGDRFRIVGRGLCAYRSGRRTGASRPHWLPPEIDDGAELPADVTGPAGEHTGAGVAPSRGLVARVGQFRVPHPIDPGKVYTAQDSGPLLVEARLAPRDEPADLRGAFAPDTTWPFRCVGLFLVKVEKVP